MMSMIKKKILAKTEGRSDMKTTKSTMKYDITLTQETRNGMHLLAAKLDMSFSNVVVMALDSLLRQKLSRADFSTLDDEEFVNRAIGEAVNNNAGGAGYDAEVNPVPKNKRFYFVKGCYEGYMD
jgi:hypothetical protein